MDIDDEADLRALMQHDLSGTQTGAWLRDSRLLKKLGSESATGTNVAASS
jgi:2-phospho-L-lactate guanylyltransferase (CobY/MobA/RfbA family)